MPHSWEFIHDEIGYNYRLPNLNAALGCAQLEQLPDKLIAKRSLFERYEAAFFSVEGVNLMVEPEKCRSNYWLQTLIIDNDQLDQRDSILQATNKGGFATRPVWRLMHNLLPFSECPRMDLSCSEELSQKLINIPSSPQLI